MSLVKIDLDPDPSTLRSFGLIALFAFPALAGLVWWREGLLFFSFSTETAGAVARGLASIGLAAGLLSALYPRALRPLYLGLTLLTFPIGFVMSPVILAALYFLVLTPVGLVLRLVGSDPMQRALDQSASTYWEEKAPVTDSQSYFKQY